MEHEEEGLVAGGGGACVEKNIKPRQISCDEW